MSIYMLIAGQGFYFHTHYVWTILKRIKQLHITKIISREIFLLFLHEHICCWYSLEALLMSTSNIYFHGEIRKYLSELTSRALDVPEKQ